MSDGTCQECRYYVQKYGECHRFPPTDKNSGFPEIGGDEWCGEFMFTNEVILQQRKEHFK